ncbi:MAG: hypothetical protein RLO17_25040 [Cyclobacteriaceae bacterium]
MIEEEFVKKILSGSNIEVPVQCYELFEHHFKGALNPEWQLKGDIFEVLFHKEGIEYIAELDAMGELIKYKMNLNKELLPTLIRSRLEKEREIMNVVLINKRDHIMYEIIVRSSALSRFRLIVDQMGEVIEEMPL